MKSVFLATMYSEKFTNALSYAGRKHLHAIPPLAFVSLGAANPLASVDEIISLCKEYVKDTRVLVLEGPWFFLYTIVNKGLETFV